MKIYVASKFENQERVQEIQTLLRYAGHTITYDWTGCEDFSTAQAMRDFRGVMDADAFVGVFEKDLAYKGALVEFGIALGQGKVIYILGDGIDRCIFLKHPNVHQGWNMFTRDLLGGVCATS